MAVFHRVRVFRCSGAQVFGTDDRRPTTDDPTPEHLST
jgi:hypothetical protein